MLLFIQVALLVTDVLSIIPILGFDAVSLSVVLILQCRLLLLALFSFCGLTSQHPGPVPALWHSQGLGCGGDAL